MKKLFPKPVRDAAKKVANPDSKPQVKPPKRSIKE
jgi:hypothetical protein